MGDSSRMTCFFITRRWRRAVLLACLLFSAPAWSADILLTAAEDGAGVQAFTQALAQQRPEDHVTFTPLKDMPAPSRLPANTRLILLDLPGLDWRLQDTQGPPTLVLRISRLQAHQRLGSTQHPRISLLWSDPPLERQLRLIASILPQARRIGVLYGADSEFLLPELRQHATPLGLEIVPQLWGNINDSRPLQTLFRNSDVLLGLDDPQLYNPKTAKNLLLSSYAQQLPLVGPNAGFVRAGSLASTYSDQADWLTVLDRLLDHPPGNWPRSLYPERFKVVGNPQVARSLGIEQVDEASVATRLAEGEKRP
ncbi:MULTISPECIES: ABC transporter substrate-binding protein [Pseudomonas]|uniref:ABC transporter substrate-binding protein n=1 Tax=Pseudomonas pergaminensis TaxID=2853159 RepID=A0ABD7TMZ8_9PSED|nr:MULTISPECIES: ABC transporter substrate-binding protein [Pseudomonas]PIB47558.1 ABC transporter substrate-binding protein [Pseudomonas sp. 2588-5]AQT93514.1 ABC transporter substrate-binding protein [Pseudomonas azotoformans]MBT1263526.1 ABC transporter substrate-binding protein [Pseudomonas sp. VS40]MBT1275369.1 ABC transporter substrate-binding protein [Pseudomonas sp. VS59]UMY51280.1 ABC transporter substrate-binding protein [Pseudomonas azotoformans]